MPSIIANGTVTADNWSRVDAAQLNRAPGELPAGDLLVPLALWEEKRTLLLARQHAGRLGLLLEGDDDPTAIAADLRNFALVAVDFPKAGDGRGYSTGRLLRERLGYRGELRATGDIGRDHLFALAQCGFDSFALAGNPADSELAAALHSLNDFSDAYQSTVAQPLPLYRRRIYAHTA
jgi:uncharacterized protein (DUF934 family)